MSMNDSVNINISKIFGKIKYSTYLYINKITNMSYNKTHKHTENGLITEEFRTYNTGFIITTSIATGIDGESTCIIINDNNLYPDSDSRSKRTKEYIIPIDDTNDLRGLYKSIKKALKRRKKTLIQTRDHKKS
jgi:hypothetical protein